MYYCSSFVENLSTCTAKLLVMILFVLPAHQQFSSREQEGTFIGSQMIAPPSGVSHLTVKQIISCQISVICKLPKDDNLQLLIRKHPFHYFLLVKSLMCYSTLFMI